MKFKNWKKVNLQEITDKIGDGLHGTPIYDSEGEYYFINGNNLNRDIIIDHNTKKVGSEEYLKYKKELNDSSILLSINGTVGNLALYNNEKVLLGKSACYINVKKNIDRDFIYYLLFSNYFKHYIESHSSGTTIKNLGLKEIREFTFSLPNQYDQNLISSNLFTFDKKIEFNNKINKNLEETALTLYKRWFVDFEFPNEKGEPYKSSGGEMVDSELGLIPKGWEVKKLDNFIPVLTGKKNANVAKNNGIYSFFTCGQEVLKTDDYSFEGDAILVAGNGDFNVKYFSGKFEAYQRTYVLIPKNEKLSGLLFYSIKHNLKNITKSSRGSVINFITKGSIANFKIAAPFNTILESKAKIFKDFLITIAKNDLENENLKSLRDLLLPKLMSGEIEVPIEE